MAGLTNLDARTASDDEILQAIDRDAAVVLGNALAPSQIDAILGSRARFQLNRPSHRGTIATQGLIDGSSRFT